MSVGIISMVNHTALFYMEEQELLHEHIIIDNTVGSFVHANVNNSEPDLDLAKFDGEFVWSNEIQLTIITSYMFAYTVSNYSSIILRRL